jgi:hypothetical protein
MTMVTISRSPVPISKARDTLQTSMFSTKVWEIWLLSLSREKIIAWIGVYFENGKVLVTDFNKTASRIVRSGKFILM